MIPEVDLSSRRLRSPSHLHLPLCHLPHLTSLSLQENHFSGPLPPELPHCVNLQHLNLGANNFSGPLLPFPSTLRYLNLSLNSFFGETLPSTLHNLQNLQIFDVAAAGLTGALLRTPLRNLQHLVLSWNPFSPNATLPGSLAQMHQLQHLECAGCGVVGPLPPWLGTLKSLQYLDFSNNRMEGTIPGEMMALPNLKWLELYKNELTGAIPWEIGKLVALTDLDLSDNRLTGGIPQEMMGLQELAVVHLQNNRLEGRIPEGVVKLTKLYDLKLYMNKLEGSIPWGLGRNCPLLQLDVSNNRLEGEIPSELCAHGKLWRLILFNNSLTGPLPSPYANCTSLLRLRLFHNHLSGPIAPALWSLPNLTLLELHDNSFSGSIPSTIAQASELSVLSLHHNRFSGPLPPELGQLKSLERLHAHHNQFTGDIPPALGQLGDRLTSLDLDANALTGKIPEELGNLVNLVHLGVSFNLLRGSIPERIGEKLEKLVFLDVSHNLLSGNLAMVVERFDVKQFEVFDCSYNGFSGTVEAIRKEWVLGNPALCFGGFSQVDSLGAIRHRNIVKLLCCCSSFAINLLVYEYMPNGSLGDLLHNTKAKALLDWSLRSKIAVGAAQGLTYLHHDCNPQILHRDIKSNNILLDDEYEAHIADFGLAKCFNDISMSIVAGSYGYIAPEYAYTLNVNEKSDVFSFGVVLLELVTGRQPIATEFGDAMTIVTWVAKNIREQGENIVIEFLDKRIIDLSFYKSQMLNVFHIANCCTQHLPKDRPTMREITKMLIESQKIGNKKIP